jgi:rubredoxin
MIDNATITASIHAVFVLLTIPQAEKSMSAINWENGECPECLLKRDEHQVMKVNLKDYWECPACRLRIVTAIVDTATIMSVRGHGRIHEKAYAVTELIKTPESHQFAKQPLSMDDAEEYLLTRDEVLAYLETLLD